MSVVLLAPLKEMPLMILEVMLNYGVNGYQKTELTSHQVI